MGGSWVYVKSEASLWTVGFYGPEGVWHSDSDHGTSEDAAARVAYLNGGGRGLEDRIEHLEGWARSL
jgi:hypothetical protein